MRAAAAEATATNKHINRTALMVYSHHLLHILIFFQAITPVAMGAAGGGQRGGGRRGSGHAVTRGWEF